MGQEQKTSDATRSANRRFLIAEDNLVNQKLILAHVENLGYQADVVANGADALDALVRSPYALVLMDCQMPLMDGLTATVEIRKREGDQRHTPIIAVTANGNRDRCLEAGMDDYVSKPLRQRELAAAIARWITQRPGKHSANSNDEKANGAARKTGEACTPLENGELDGTAKMHNVDAFSDATISERLAELRDECGAEMVAGFIEAFVTDSAARLTDLHFLTAQQDSTAVEREAHSLKGSCANLGVERMAAICHQLEEEAEAGSLRSVNEYLEQLDSEFARLNPVLASLIQLKHVGQQN